MALLFFVVVVAVAYLEHYVFCVEDFALDRVASEVYDEVLGRWLRLPCDLPHGGSLSGSALL
jgi:hypothetical protein